MKNGWAPPTFEEFVKDVGPNFWPACMCFTNDKAAPGRQLEMYHMAQETTSFLIHQMQMRGYCPTSAGTLMSIVLHQMMVAMSCHLSDVEIKDGVVDWSKVSPHYFNIMQKFDVGNATLFQRTMRIMGCSAH